MAILDDDTMQELYVLSKDAFEQSAVVNCKIQYETATKIYDEVNETYKITNQILNEEFVLVSVTEQKKNYDVISSSLITGVPTGSYNVYLKYDDKIIVSQIPNYVENSLRFIIRPSSFSPMVLHPILPLSKIEYFLEDENYPINQRFTCSVVM